MTTNTTDALQVGQKVRLLIDIFEHADEYAPAGYLAFKGEVLIIRGLKPESVRPVSVSHENITDCSFGVAYDEIEVIHEHN